MGATSGSSKTFFSSDVASIATGADSAASDVIDVPANIRKAYVQAYCTGHATGAGVVTAYVVASLDGTNYETVGNLATVAIVAGAAAKGNVAVLDVEGVSKLKVLKVHNGDAAQAVTAVNVICTFF